MTGPNRSVRQAVIAAVLMLVMAGLAYALTPRIKLVDQIGRFDLESAIPSQFGEWRVVPDRAVYVVNPQQAEVLNRIYTQTLSRTYVNGKGDRVMLSIAYGEDQRDGGMQMHTPEVCYPAQGFTLQRKWKDTLHAPIGDLAVTRLRTTLGSRHEPVTYWAVIGGNVFVGGLEKKLAEMRSGLRGSIPDGALVRVSSIDTVDDLAFSKHDQFASEMLNALSASSLDRLARTSHD